MEICYRDLVHAVGYRTGDLLGAGCDGVVYRLEDLPGFVAKVTRMQSEADIAYAVMHAKNKPGSLPVVREVHKVRFNRDDLYYEDEIFHTEYYCEFYTPPSVEGDTIEENERFIIIREDLDSVFNGTEDWNKRLALEVAVCDLGDLDREHTISDFNRIAARVRENYETSNGWTLEGELKLDNAEDFYRWCIENRIGVDDMHTRNWGIRADGTLVARDMSRCVMEDEERLLPHGIVIPFTELQKEAA